MGRKKKQRDIKASGKENMGNKKTHKKKMSIQEYVARNEKKDLERKLKRYKMKPAQYSLGTSGDLGGTNASGRISAKPKEWYDDSFIDWRTVNWAKTDEEIKEVFIFHSFLFCKTVKHNLSFYKVKIKDLKNEFRSYEANMIYCNDCKKFFIDSTQYKNIRKLGMLPNFKIRSNDIIGNNFSDFREESELFLYGYNAKRTTPTNVRQSILNDIITNKLMTQQEIISHLQGLISLGEARINMYEAVQRYEDDIEFIHKKFPGRSSHYYTSHFR